jgi:tRNA-specific 2-thiouridylase
MSGGVDSSVAAWVLQQMGYEVIGITMKTWARDHKAGEKSCCGVDAVDDAARVAAQLDIPYVALDMEQVFRETVIENFQSEYFKGRTPNPCIVCNYKLKFGYLLQKAEEFGCDFVATGHYALMAEQDGRLFVTRGKDENKDQSYVLYNLTQEQLKKTLLPIGGYTKERIREIAREQGFFRVAAKPDSVGICFVTDSYKDYLKAQARDKMASGDMLDVKGAVVGRHEGIALYTIGQRKGLGVSFPEKTFVTNIDPDNNTVTIGQREDLLRWKIEVRDLNWMGLAPQTEPFEAMVKIRYHHKPVVARCEPNGDLMQVVFFSPQEAVAPGQSAVLYDGDKILAGGIINKAC